MQTTQGELVNNSAKLSEVEREIQDLEKLIMNALDWGDEDELVKKLREQLRDKQIERSSRLEVVSINKGALSSQFNRIKETYRRIMNEDKTLGERINTIFREQDITIVSTLTAISL